ncbi:MAG: hypothetical protein LN590_01060 [Rickettsia endosymbiont of Glossina mortisans submortisans]|nr:hypothetical protein [Rickettsia endosymbiont of Glossina mortisans submortisans]
MDPVVKPRDDTECVFRYFFISTKILFVSFFIFIIICIENPYNLTLCQI